MAPSATRGRYVSSYQLAITIGILLADISDAALSSGGKWRLMLGLSIVPGVLLVLIAMAMPDTPRWYLRSGRRAEAKATLAKTLGGPDLDGRLDTMQAELAETAGVKWKDVFAPSLRRALWVGIGLAVFHQVTGINAVIYYSDKIFDFAGFTLARTASSTVVALAHVMTGTGGLLTPLDDVARSALPG
jgi:MFS family permease